MTILDSLKRSKATLEAGKEQIKKSKSILTMHWPDNAPDYFTKEGWEFEKKMAEEKLREQFKK